MKPAPAQTIQASPSVTWAAFDETAARRGHDYVSLFVDLDGPRGLFVTNGKDADAARTVTRHWHGILRWFDSKIANGILEGINSLVQAAKAKARGHRSTRNWEAIIYLIAGKLELKRPT